MDAQICATTGADLDRRDNTLVLENDRFPGDETVKSVLNLQPVTALAKTFLHNPSPFLAR